MPTQTAGLGIEITAEVARAVANLRNINDEFEHMGEEAKKALAEASGAIDDLTKGTVSINRLSKALNVFRQASLNATDPHSLEQYNRSIQQLEQEIARLSNAGREANNNLPGTGRMAVNASGALTDLGRVAQDLPFGFIAIQNNLSPLVDSFGRVITSSGGVVAGLKAIGASLIGAGGIGLAFSAVTSLVTVAVQKYGSLGAALEALFTSQSQAQKEQKLLNEVMNAAAENAQKNIVQLDTLYRAATNVNIPLAERNKIVDELQNKYPAYFKNLSDETILAGRAQKAYEGLRDALIANANARALEDELVKQGTIIAQARIKQAELLAQREKQVNKLTEERNKLNKSSAFTQALFSVFPSDADAELIVLGSLDLKLKDVGKTIADVTRIQDLLVKSSDDLIQTQGAAGAGIEITGKNAVKSSRHIKTAADIIKELNEDLSGLDTRFLVTGGSLQDLTENKLKAFGSALVELNKIGIGPGNNIFDNLFRNVKSLQNVLTVIKPPTIKVPIEVLPTVNNAQTVALLNKNLATFEAPLNEFTQKINAMIQGVLVDGVSAIFEGLGEGLVTGNFTNVLKSFANVISGYLSQLGKTLIVTGLGIEAFKNSLKSLQGIQAIAAGGAMILAAGAFKALANKGPNAYATGGFAIGPQLAVIGDNPGRKEMIVPSEDFSKLGGGGNFTVTTRLSGRDILLVIQREGRELNRFN